MASLADFQQSSPAPSPAPVQDPWSVNQWSDRQWNNASDWKLSAASARADAVNQLNMAQYNNEYNAWLWRMQTEYNSPENQVARLKAAGLNPNFNSIEGAGNASSPSPSTGSLKSNFLGSYQASISARAQKLNEINSVVSAFNDLVKNIGQGLDMYKTYVNTPSGPSMYRSDLNTLLHNRAASSSFDATLKEVLTSIAIGEERYSNSPLGLAYLGDFGARAWQSQIAQQKFDNLKADKDLKDITFKLKQYENNELQPKQARKLEEEIENLLSRTRFVDTQDAMYNRLKVGGMLLPFAMMLFKSLL